MATVCVSDIKIEACSLDDAISITIDRARNREGMAVRLVNAYSVACTASDPKYKRLLSESGVNFADGTPVAWTARLRDERAQHVRGPSLFTGVLAAGREFNLTHGFVGSTEATLDALVAAAESRFPGLRVSSSFSPSFTPDCDQIVREIENWFDGAGVPDIVWVGLGAPKQDFVAERLAQALQRPCLGVGAAFDFVAGTAAEAPTIVQGSGLEWLYRLCKEPRRLWKRYIVGNFVFIRLVFPQLVVGLVSKLRGCRSPVAE